jgi:hypothetical protein
MMSAQLSPPPLTSHPHLEILPGKATNQRLAPKSQVMSQGWAYNVFLCMPAVHHMGFDEITSSSVEIVSDLQPNRVLA